MSTRNRQLVLVAAGILLASHPVMAQKAHKVNKTRSEMIFIANTGSYNTVGYDLELYSDSRVIFVILPPPGEEERSLPRHPGEVAKTLTEKIFHDVHIAGKLSKLPVGHGMQSGIFISKLIISYNGQTSPDLTLPGSDMARALHDDALALARVLNLGGPRQLSQEAKPSTAVVETATIKNTGSTNTAGYQIVVSSDGNASSVGEAAPGTAPENFPKPQVQALSKEMTTTLFADLDAAMPLTSLSVRHGMRSVSFGTSTYITYKGQKSPDLTFGGDGPADALKADIAAITQALHVRNAPRRPLLMRPLTP